MMDPIRRGFNNKHGVCVVCGVVARPVAERAAATDTERESVANAERVASGETRAAQRRDNGWGRSMLCVAVRPRCRRVARKSTAKSRSFLRSSPVQAGLGAVLGGGSTFEDRGRLRARGWTVRPGPPLGHRPTA